MPAAAAGAGASNPQQRAGLQLQPQALGGAVPRAHSVGASRTPGRHHTAAQDSAQMATMLSHDFSSGSFPNTPMAASGTSTPNPHGRRAAAPMRPGSRGAAYPGAPVPSDDPFVLGPRRPASEPPSGAASSAAGGRVGELKATLHALELQLGSLAGAGRGDTGSEARYYALSKKLQKVRADLLREQRDANELESVQREVAAVRRQRVEDRRTFRR